MKKQPLDVFLRISMDFYPDEYEENNSIRATCGQIFLNGRTEEEKDDKIIGEFSYFYMDLLPVDLLSALDEQSQYLFNMGEDMLDEDGEFVKEFSFMDDHSSYIILDNVSIDKEYRGHGVVKEVIKYLRCHYESAVIILKAHPLETKNLTKAEMNKSFDKIIEAYKKCGFKQVKRGSFYMYNPGGHLIP